jgi:hypothetical protein
MTKARDPRPEPTQDSGYDSYYWPRSKTPEKQALYDYLAAINWRFDTVQCRWHTPESLPLQGSGRLEYAADMTWARVQPPNRHAADVRAVPIATFERTAAGGWFWSAPDEPRCSCKPDCGCVQGCGLCPDPAYAEVS